MTVIENYTNCVKIHDTLIPAVNIQVDDVPGYIAMADGRTDWFGVYFEIMFEEGALWVVSQGDNPADITEVLVEEYDKWGRGNEEISYAQHFGTWDDFLERYKRRIINRSRN